MQPRYLVDANLPSRFAYFNSPAFVYDITLGIAQNDDVIWKYAIAHNPIILTRDFDFYRLLLTYGPPSSLVWFRIHRMAMHMLHNHLATNWAQMQKSLETYGVVEVHTDRLVCSYPSSTLKNCMSLHSYIANTHLSTVF